MSEKPETIESKVPGEQAIRGDGHVHSEVAGASAVDMADFIATPVVTVKKEESSFTKGGLKVQKVVVTEDVSNGTTTTKMMTVTETSVPSEDNTEVCGEDTSIMSTESGDGTREGSQRVVNKITRIPKLKFKRAVDEVKKQDELIKEGKDEASRALQMVKALQKTTDKGTVQKQQTIEQQTLLQHSPKVEDEFDKIYDEISDSSSLSGNFPTPENIEDPDKLENKFEELIHAYDEQREQTTVEKVKSKIPLLKRKSEAEIDVTKPTIRKNSLKKRNSIDDAKCKLPVPRTKERDGEIESNKNKPPSSLSHDVNVQSNSVVTKNVNVSNTVNTSVTRVILTQKKYETVTSQSESNLTSYKEVSKSKIPMHFKKLKARESNHKTPEISSHLSIGEKKESFYNIINNNETDENKTNNTGDYTITLNIKEKISKIEAKPKLTETLKTEVFTNETIQKEIQSTVDEKQTHNEKDFEHQTSATERTSAIEPNTKEKYSSNSVSKLAPNDGEPELAQSQNEITPNITIEEQVEKINNHSNKTEIIQQAETKTDVKETNKLTNGTPQRITSNTNIKQDNMNDSVNKLANTEIKVQTHTDVREDEVKVVTSKYSSSLNSERTSFTRDNKTNVDQNTLRHICKEASQVGYETKPLGTKELTTYEEPNLCHKNTMKESINGENEERPKNVKQQVDVNTTEGNKCSKLPTRSINEVNNRPFSLERDDPKDKYESMEHNSSIEITKEEYDTEMKIDSMNMTMTTKIEKDIRITTQRSKDNQNITTEEEVTDTTPEEKHKIANKITEGNNNETKEQDINENVTNKDVNNTNSPTSPVNLDEVEEEDIIILKGKVNRIIRRLDSKEYRSKREIEDVPCDVSVVNKIALFEQTKDSVERNTLNKTIKEDQINVNKPKIVDEVLKTDKPKENENIIENDSVADDSRFSYDTFLDYKRNVRREISLKDNIEQRTRTRSAASFEEIYQYNINLNNYGRMNVLQTRDGGGKTDTSEVVTKENKISKDIDIIREYKMNKEMASDMRGKSADEPNYGGVRGRVRQMVVRMNSMDRMALERREQTEARRRMRQGSVTERVELFEKKVTASRSGTVSNNNNSPTKEEEKEKTTQISEEELKNKIEELSQARVTYGTHDDMTDIELSDGAKMATLAVGTALLDDRLVKAVIKAAIDLGYRAIDTAYIYGNERAVGDAIREKMLDGTVRREDLFIISKLWSTSHRRDLVPRACRLSLDAMGLDYFDLYLIHNPMSFKEGPNPLPKIANVLQYSEHDYLEAWFGIEGLIKQGLVRRAGLSNFNSAQVQRVLDKGKIKPVINQVECHPYLSQSRLREFLAPRGVSLSCFGVLGSAGTPQGLRSPLPPVIHDPLVRTMAAGLGVSPAQLLISYQVHLGHNVVVKASSARHLHDNLRALRLHLEPTHVAALAALNRNKRTFTFQGMGDTHRNYPFKIPF